MRSIAWRATFCKSFYFKKKRIIVCTVLLLMAVTNLLSKFSKALSICRKLSVRISENVHSIFRNFRKRGQPRVLYPNFWKFPSSNSCFILFSLLRDFRKISYFDNLTIFGFSGNFPRKLTKHLSPLGKFRNFWLNGKCP